MTESGKGLIRVVADALLRGLPGFHGGQGDGLALSHAEGVFREFFLELIIDSGRDVLRRGINFIEGHNIVKAGVVEAL